MAKKSILFIINNLSGTVSKFNIPEYVNIYLDFNLYTPSYLIIDKNLKKSVYKSTLESPWDVIVTVGGDGTLMKLGKRIVNKDVMLGIIPVGSGNGLATHIGYKPRDIRGAIEAINRQKTRKVDLAVYNDKKYFFSNLGLGFDAEVAASYKNKENRSFWVYSRLTLQKIFGFKPIHVHYESNNQKKECKALLFNVFNSNLYGYGVGLLPWPQADDGILDVGYLEAVPFYKLPWIGLCILIKKPNWTKHIHYFETTHIKIFNSKSLDFQVDGDPKKTSEDIDVKILPHKLTMIVP